MEVLHFTQLDEKLYYEKLANGLTVYILPKKGFSKTYATFTTKYGSVDRTFIPIGKEEPITVPDGIAHFLEHKMFEKEDEDVFQKFSEQGASANAFTSFTRTAYLFSSTGRVYDNTKTLLDFVQQPYFTEETVNKEKGIIGQEITMYDDQPSWRLYFGAIENMYHNYPVKIDIAGTIASIDEITAEHLYTCYNTFYHPSNMLLFIIGAVDPQEMMDFVRADQAAKDFPQAQKIERFFDDEPTDVAIKHRTLHMDVQKPKVYVGLKARETSLQGVAMLKHELALDMAMELLFGRTSAFYERLYEAGLVDETYDAGFMLEKGYGFSLIGTDTNEPDAFIQAVKDELQQLEKHIAFTEEEVAREKRRTIGATLRQLNYIESIANQFTRYAFNDMNLFDVVPTLEKITAQDLIDAFQSIQGESQQTSFVILPLEENA
ncbi:peptidase [Lysinibacillus alkalisoli]|uniref:Peptidase n=1 Tax=Lysinibacillus alkalisoli TaxID=1911548 RepID=A0A917G4G0_9BACI|nr:pitrilysin family protein [Lysinibacillus alkalisoli]GGG22320.1 peptidase [Lysinibacillus alkalisoli]